MEALSLNKALELYEILGPHIPKVEDEITDALYFIGKIIENINSSNKHEDYTLAVELMSDKNWEEIKTFNSEKVLELFIEGLTVNKIVQLKYFCDAVGFEYA